MLSLDEVRLEPYLDQHPLPKLQFFFIDGTLVDLSNLQKQSVLHQQYRLPSAEYPWTTVEASYFLKSVFLVPHGKKHMHAKVTF